MVNKELVSTPMPDHSDITRNEFLARFKARMVAMAPFPAFDNGQTVADYADEIGPTYWDNPEHEGPEESADADMSYWGEE